jgi:hypothetical protein
VTFHELVRHSVEQPNKLVYKLLGGSYELMSVLLDNMTSDHRVAGSSPAGCRTFTINDLKVIIGL